MSTKFRWTPSSTGHRQRARWDGQTLTYDPLIEHLNLRGVHATRCASLGDIPIVKAAPGAISTDDKLSLIIAYLVKRGTQRPASRKTLITSAAALFQPKLSNNEAQELLAELERSGVFVEHGTRIAYSLPD